MLEAAASEGNSCYLYLFPPPGNLYPLLKLFFFPLSLFIYLFIFLLYNIVLVLPYIDMNPPWVYMEILKA